MKQVLKVSDLTDVQEKKELKPIEFTHYLSPGDGWRSIGKSPDDYNKVVYLGKCVMDGDMFAAYHSEHILIYKGHLNDGVY